MNASWRILVVEDDPDGQEVVAHILQYLEVQIDRANDAEQASVFLSRPENKYNAIIIDLALPGKDGWELLSEIKADPARKDIPCIAVTAHHTARLRNEAIVAGFKAYFSKPLDATGFARQLDAML